MLDQINNNKIYIRNYFESVFKRMRSSVVFDGILVSLDIDPTVCIVLSLLTGAVESVAFDGSTTRAFLNVDAFGGNIGTDFIV